MLAFKEGSGGLQLLGGGSTAMIKVWSESLTDHVMLFDAVP